MMGARVVPAAREMAGIERSWSGARAALLATVAAFSLSGCGVYMHDASLKTSTAQAKASFDALGTPALFEAQRQTLAEFARQEDEAVAGYASALRNEAVLTFLRPSGNTRTTVDAETRLRTLVNRDLNQVYGRYDLRGDQLHQLQNVGEAKLFNRQLAGNLNALAESQRRNFLKLAPSDPRPTSCEKVPPLPAYEPGKSPLPEGASVVDDAYARLQSACQRARSATGGAPERLVVPDAGGDIGRLRAEIAQVEKDRAADAKRASELKAQIDAALKAEKAAPAPTFEALTARLEPILAQLEQAPPFARLIGLEEVAGILEDRVVGELRSLPSELEDNAQAAAALAFVGAARDTAQAFSAKPDQDKAAALLIGLATVRHQLNMAQADVALKEKERENLERQLEALLIRASHLARAKSALQRNPPRGLRSFVDVRDMKDEKGRTAASEALTSYIAAWNSGEIPYHVLRFRAVQARRVAALDRAQVAEQDYRAVVKPAVDTLAEYGAGGITPEAIVTLLGHLGISGSILAK